MSLDHSFPTTAIAYFIQNENWIMTEIITLMGMTLLWVAFFMVVYAVVWGIIEGPL